ncbi:Nodulation-signaling pathway 2 protein [Apostasia shenzhenica]|uniref:Nodulation-signaling pathway 2 protein n=1 Tax=Apostasia shenzhenica TaxID=1088818 RepID=A0A2I0AD72_9ASPA|nr:Nodulation-signaling pathway 2 protein [Apostasia shenzhenica]
MELGVEYMADLMISAGSSTTTVEGDLSLNCLSPEVNWWQVPQDDDDFRRLIAPAISQSSDFSTPNGLSDESCCFQSSKTAGDTPTEEPTSPAAGDTPMEEPTSPAAGEEDKALRLVHLLMAAAEAISGEQMNRGLARVILVRLKELLAGGVSGMERLATHFTDALQSLLDSAEGLRRGNTGYPAGDVLTALQLLQDMSPCASFAYLTANQAILEAVAGERRVHIVDFNVNEGVQWASLIQALAGWSNRATAPPYLRITAITGGNRKSSAAAQETGRRLSAFAASIGQPFSFRTSRLHQGRIFMPSAVKLVKGEAVVVNCAQIKPCSRAAVGSFLAGAEALGARIVTVVEEESVITGAGGGEGDRGFVGRFMGELERYMALWESLETGYPLQGRVRGLVEKVIMGPRITGAVRRAYGLPPEERESAAEWAAAAGFGRVGMSFFNLCQARLLLGLFNDGYRIDREGTNKLVLSWKSRRLLAASVWSPSPAPATSQVFGWESPDALTDSI